MSSDPPLDSQAQQIEPVSATESSAPALGQNALPADIRKQVEQEQALVDAQKRLKELEADNERLLAEKKEVEEARDSSGKLTSPKYRI
jgi:nucleoprotein TPR